MHLRNFLPPPFPLLGVVFFNSFFLLLLLHLLHPLLFFQLLPPLTPQLLKKRGREKRSLKHPKHAVAAEYKYTLETFVPG